MTIRPRVLLSFYFLGLLAGCGEQKPADSARADSRVEVDAYLVPAAANSSGGYSVATTLTVEHEADLLAQEQARLVEVLADQGQRVQGGQVLAKLDDTEVRKQYEQNKAAMQSSEVQTRESEVVRQAAMVELQRQSDLRKEGLGTQRDYDRAKFNLEAMGQEVEKAKFDFERATARVAADEIRLGRMQIRAPFNGIISRRYAHVGQILMKDEKVLRLTELRPLLVRFTVPESFRHTLRTGAMVDVIPADQSLPASKARVTRTGYVVDAASGLLECVARVTQPVGASLVPGMAVDVRVSGVGGPPAAGIWIPRAAVRRGASGSADVFAIQGERLQQRAVKIGREAQSSVQVLAGLSAGDRIVAQVSDALQDGMAVHVRQ